MSNTTHIARDHPPIEEVPKMTGRQLWTYVLAELDFLSSPEQKRVPAAVSTAMHELARRDRRK